MPPFVHRFRTAAFVLLLMAAASSAHAKATAVSPYTLPQTFGAALRLLRVDLGLEVTERDAEAAYLLFQYRSNDEAKHPVEGAVELIALENEVRVVIKIPALPEAHERLLRDRLVKKLREDFGEPPKRKPAAKPADPAKPAEPNKPHPAPPNEDEKPAP